MSDLSNSGGDSCSKKATAVFQNKSSYLYFVWRAIKLTPEVETHSVKEGSRKIYRVCEAIPGESLDVPLHLLMEKRFEQHRRNVFVNWGLFNFLLEPQEADRYYTNPRMTRTVDKKWLIVQRTLCNSNTLMII